MKIYFDYDGPILDVKARSWAVHKQVVTMLGGNTFGTRARHWLQKQERTHKGIILAESNLDPKLENDYLGKYIALIETDQYLRLDRVVTGVLPVLESLAQNHDLVLVTLRKNIKTALQQIKQLGINQYFSSILVGGEELAETTGQAKVRMIKSEAVQSHMLGEIIVGDTEGEILAAQELGITSVAVLGGIRSKNYLQKLSPDFMIEHIQELPAIIAMVDENN